MPPSWSLLMTRGFRGFTDGSSGGLSRYYHIAIITSYEHISRIWARPAYAWKWAGSGAGDSFIACNSRCGVARDFCDSDAIKRNRQARRTRKHVPKDLLVFSVDPCRPPRLPFLFFGAAFALQCLNRRQKISISLTVEDLLESNYWDRAENLRECAGLAYNWYLV